MSAMPLPDRPRRRRRRLLVTAARLYTALLMADPPDNWFVPAPDGRYGPADGEALTLLLLGDSLAQSIGVGAREETMGARLAQALSEATGTAVDLRVPARAGATTRVVQRQAVRATGRCRAGVAVLVVGGNDTMLPVLVRRSARRFAQVLDVLRTAGWQVVVLPCPDPGAAPGFRAWVRWAAARRARLLARLQTRIALRAGALVGPSAAEDFLRRAELLSADGVHPSAVGYAEHAVRVLPVLLAAAGRGLPVTDRGVGDCARR